MTRFRRILLYVCLLLTGVAAAAWVRTQIDRDLVVRTGAGGRYYEWATIPGQLRFTVVNGWSGKHQPLRWYRGNPPRMPVFGLRVIRNWFPAGFVTTDGRQLVPAPAGVAGRTTVRVNYRIYTIPIAPLMLLFAAYPWALAWRTIRDRRTQRERLSQGLCPACGYDLRASSGRCPECGSPAASAPAVSLG